MPSMVSMKFYGEHEDLWWAWSDWKARGHWRGFI